jgi:hypothetical protein
VWFQVFDEKRNHTYFNVLIIYMKNEPNLEVRAGKNNLLPESTTSGVIRISCR